jgi:hypothetical protein
LAEQRQREEEAAMAQAGGQNQGGNPAADQNKAMVQNLLNDLSDQQVKEEARAQ